MKEPSKTADEWASEMERRLSATTGQPYGSIARQVIASAMDAARAQALSDALRAAQRPMCRCPFSPCPHDEIIEAVASLIPAPDA